MKNAQDMVNRQNTTGFTRYTPEELHAWVELHDSAKEMLLIMENALDEAPMDAKQTYFYFSDNYSKDDIIRFGQVINAMGFDGSSTQGIGEYRIIVDWSDSSPATLDLSDINLHTVDEDEVDEYYDDEDEDTTDEYYDEDFDTELDTDDWNVVKDGQDADDISKQVVDKTNNPTMEDVLKELFAEGLDKAKDKEAKKAQKGFEELEDTLRAQLPDKDEEILGKAMMLALIAGAVLAGDEEGDTDAN